MIWIYLDFKIKEVKQVSYQVPFAILFYLQSIIKCKIGLNREKAWTTYHLFVESYGYKKT